MVYPRRYTIYPKRYCIRHIHIALWVRKVVLNELDGGFHFKRPVRSLCVVPEEVLHQPDVELFWVKELVLMIVNILLLDGAVKAFGMGVHLSAFISGVFG